MRLSSLRTTTLNDGIAGDVGFSTGASGPPLAALGLAGPSIGEVRGSEDPLDGGPGEAVATVAGGLEPDQGRPEPSGSQGRDPDGLPSGTGVVAMDAAAT
jgi:hypothetical protein